MAAKKQGRAKPGDVLEVKSSRGHSYVQYVGKHPEYGDVIRVLPGCFNKPQHDFGSLVESTGYIAFYPARAAISQGLARIRNSFPLPSGIEVPRHLRRAGARERDGKVRTWIIEQDEQEIMREQLTESERQLPIAAIWSHDVLTLSIFEGWHPSQEG